MDNFIKKNLDLLVENNEIKFLFKLIAELANYIYNYGRFIWSVYPNLEKNSLTKEGNFDNKTLSSFNIKRYSKGRNYPEWFKNQTI